MKCIKAADLYINMKWFSFDVKVYNHSRIDNKTISSSCFWSQEYTLKLSFQANMDERSLKWPLYLLMEIMGIWSEALGQLLQGACDEANFLALYFISHLGAAYSWTNLGLFKCPWPVSLGPWFSP